MKLKSGDYGSKYDSFANGFDGYYDTSGKKAGLYTFRNDEWSYAAQ